MTPKPEKPPKDIDAHKGTIYEVATGRIRLSVCLQPGMVARDHYPPDEGEAFAEGLYVEDPEGLYAHPGPMIIKDGKPVAQTEEGSDT